MNKLGNKGEGRPKCLNLNFKGLEIKKIGNQGEGSKMFEFEF